MLSSLRKKDIKTATIEFALTVFPVEMTIGEMLIDLDKINEIIFQAHREHQLVECIKGIPKGE